MRVKDAIKLLKENCNPEEEIIIAWWDRSCFNTMTDDEWGEASEAGDDMDWSGAHEDIEREIEERK